MNPQAKVHIWPIINGILSNVVKCTVAIDVQFEKVLPWTISKYFGVQCTGSIIYPLVNASN